MKKYLLIEILCFSLLFSKENAKKFWIYFTSKEMPVLSKGPTPEEIHRATGITKRALHRRAKMKNSIVTEEDFPVTQTFLSKLKSTGIKIEKVSRWFNAVTAYLTAEEIQTLLQFPFIKEIKPVHIFSNKELPDLEDEYLILPKISAENKFSYGQSLTQMTLINAVAVHQIGISGRGVLVGMLDTGFRWRTHEALQNLHIVAEYDFIQEDSITENQIGDSSDQDSHGTSTLSLVGGFKDGVLISPAFNAEFILGKTEYVPTETNIEEDNWVAALEWMEQHGIDVVSSSLGYSTFDPGQTDYTYQDMDGKTAITTKAAVIASRKGVVVVNAMGNEGNKPWHYLTAPADADSIIAVGAVSSSGIYASFSGVGPTSDGRIKPDVVSHGVRTFCATTGNTGYSNSTQGTSYATPLTAGVAAMILSAHPELTPVQVRDALRNTASNAFSPNNTIGWGIINAYEAVLYNGMAISTDPDTSVTDDGNLSVGMYVVSHNVINQDSVFLLYSTDSGVTFTKIKMELTSIIDAMTNSGKYSCVIPRQYPLQFSVQAVEGEKKLPVEDFYLKQNYPNPFNPTTTVSFDLYTPDIVTLKVYDLLGREIAVLVHNYLEARTYNIPFSATSLASGIYFYRLQTSTSSETKKMIVVK